MILNVTYGYALFSSEAWCILIVNVSDIYISIDACTWQQVWKWADLLSDELTGFVDVTPENIFKIHAKISSECQSSKSWGPIAMHRDNVLKKIPRRKSHGSTNL